jgi:predicted nucleic acid-binding protein
MRVYPDTSFLCALYREQDNSARADAVYHKLGAPLPVTALVLFEFRQSVRLQTFLHRKDAAKGYAEREGTQMLADLQSDLAENRLQIRDVDWAIVIDTAETLSSQQTGAGGYRAFDVLHVATAIELGATEFLTFDSRQAALARGAGLKVKL